MKSKRRRTRDRLTLLSGLIRFDVCASLCCPTCQTSTFALAMQMIVARSTIAQETPLGRSAMNNLREYVNTKDGSEMVLIPEGEFLMGSDEGYPSERPAHRVFVSEFYIAKN